MKKKLLSGKILTRKLDQAIRDIFKLKYGHNVRCFVTGQHLGWFHPRKNKYGCQVGHFIKRKYTQLRWDLKNVEPQSSSSNMLHNENPIPYTNAILKAYGQERLDYLDAKMRERPPTTLQKREILEELLKLKESLSNNT